VKHLLCLFTALTLLATARGQTTTAFTFQGKLNDNGVAANASYDMQLKLYDTAAPGTGTQIGATITLSAVPVTNGVFTVQPDFSANAFPGADRFVEVGVKPAGSGNPFNILNPRQPITPTPYSLHSLSSVTANSATNATNASNATTATNSTQLGGQAASNYVQTNDSRLMDARAPLAGSTNYIQNTTTQEAGSFNISLNGTLGGTLSANAVNSATQYNIGGNRVLGASAAAENTYAGILAGNVNTGGNNSFFGSQAGVSNAGGSNNSFIGDRAGFLSSSGGYNSFIGTYAGYHNTSGVANLFVGYDAGDTNTTGTGNTLIGSSANVSANNLTNATAIGNGAIVSQSNSLVLGHDVNVGIGTTTPNTLLTLSGGPVWTANSWTSSMNLQNGSALGWEVNAAGNHFGIGQSNGGLFFFRTNSAFGNTASPANYNMVITDAGDVTQPRDKGGLVKAMAFLDPFKAPAQYVVRGYNSEVAGAATSTITMTRSAAGNYTVNFGFDVSDRFVFATLWGGGYYAISTIPGGTANNAVDVYVTDTVNIAYADARFFLFVY
jgi:hypothetical protein